MVKRKSSSDAEAIANVNYEAKVSEIEKIIARIEAGELELEDVFEQFATAVEYLRQCESFLQQRQKQVDLLIETLNDD
ncbi:MULTISPECIES: exodeoxyribonuclease VII small subunit [Nostocales]|uniref:exodeoxyribonuclease VII small subunit n=1 Tax=Nostocales TaxID=1161 RepID=UPI001685494A|nr:MULTISPECIES: exodeoxyribonuclease VII small subunit [Nostocales]MBD2297645.1 exodeoxyribonuclease VII small subunit [Nostoc sp. FACHB-190]MBD2487398.1 exodeoxyribonuclease VII small subunit [Aulosira sp. FACHB-615]